MVKLVVIHFGPCKKKAPQPKDRVPEPRYGSEEYWGVIDIENYRDMAAGVNLGDTIEDATKKMIHQGLPFIQEVANPDGVTLKRFFQLVK